MSTPIHIPRAPGRNMALRRRAFTLFVHGRPITDIARELNVSRQWAYYILWPRPSIARMAERLARARDPERKLRCEQCGIELHRRGGRRGGLGPGRIAWCWHQRGNHTMEPDEFDEPERIAPVCRSCELFNHSGPQRGKGTP